jgi:hypothetical protein
VAGAHLGNGGSLHVLAERSMPAVEHIEADVRLIPLVGRAHWPDVCLRRPLLDVWR